MKNPLVRIEKLSKTFSTQSFFSLFRPKHTTLPSIDDVSFEMYQGEFLGLIGESGSGKTTLGKCIVKLIHPDQGKVLIAGTDITSLSERKFRPFRKEIQVIFQDLDAALNPNMRIHQILEEILLRYKKTNLVETEVRLNQLIKQVNLAPDILHRYSNELSGGQKRRVAIAAVLAIQPKIIIADEPTTGLDNYTQSIVMQLIMRLQEQQGLTVLFISHDLQLVRQSCQRIIVLYLGNIVEIGETEQISRQQAHPYTQLLWHSHINHVSTWDNLPQTHNIKSGLYDFKRPLFGCRFAPRCTQYKTLGKPDICIDKSNPPKLRVISSSRQVACHFNLLE